MNHRLSSIPKLPSASHQRDKQVVALATDRPSRNGKFRHSPFAIRHSLLATAAAMPDIHDIEKPVFFWNPLWTLFIVLAVIALGFGLWLCVKLFRMITAPPPPPTISTEKRALTELEQAHLWMSTEKAEPFCTEVSRILRRYLERRFRLPATEQTTEEFFSREENLKRFNTEQRLELRRFSEQVDLVKFARWSLQLDELESLYQIARECVDGARAKTPDTENKEGGDHA